MELEQFGKAIALSKSAIDVLSSVVGIIPDPVKRAAAQESLEQSKMAFELAEIKTAASLGYKLCRCEWPPSICIETTVDRWLCRRCGKIQSSDGEYFSSV